MTMKALTTALTLLLCTAGPALASQITVSWLDTSTDESGFTVERCQTSDATTPCTDFAQVAQLLTLGNDPGGKIFWIDTGRTPGARYCYRVLAFNIVGNSPYSDTACATAGTMPNPPRTLIVQ